MASVPAAPVRPVALPRPEPEHLPPRPVHRYGPLAGAAAVVALPFALLGLMVRSSRPAPPSPIEGLSAVDPGVAARAEPLSLTALPVSASPMTALMPELRAPFAFPSSLAARPAPRLRLYVVPLGGVSDDSVQLLARSLEFLTGSPDVQVLPRRPLPEEAWNPTSAMYDAERLIVSLRGLRPRDGYRLFGVTDGDLYAAELRYLFGLASAYRDVAILSSVRLEEEFWDRDSDWDLYRWRFLKILAHELGHTFGLPHCRRGEACLMTAIRSLGDADAALPGFCEHCRRRIRTALADPGASAPRALPLGL